MKEFDPAVAASVWQRVQAAQETKCEEKPACPFAGIPIVPAVAEKPVKKHFKKECCRNDNRGGAVPVTVWLLLWLLCQSVNFTCK